MTRLAETIMTNMEIRALEDAGRSATAWTEGYDGHTHYAGVFKALAPATVILALAVALLVVIL